MSNRLGDYVVVYEDHAGEWRWHRKAPNHEIISTNGEGYESEDHAVEMARALNPDVILYDARGRPRY